jgi:hypothetical protein
MTGVETVDFHSWKTGLVALFVSAPPICYLLSTAYYFYLPLSPSYYPLRVPLCAQCSLWFNFLAFALSCRYLLATIYCFEPLDSRSKDLWNDELGGLFNTQIRCRLRDIYPYLLGIITVNNLCFETTILTTKN